MKLMSAEPPSAFDIIVTSPPYNIGKKYGVHKDSLPRGRYIGWMREFGVLCRKVLKETGSLFLNVGGTLEDPWLPWDVARAVSEKLVLQNVIHWIKSISVEGEDSEGNRKVETSGHFKPIVSRRFINDCHEYVFHFTKDGARRVDKLAIGVPYKDKSNISRWKSAGRDLRDRGNVWFIPYETIRSWEQRPHPATFPKKLPEMCIRLHGITDGMKVLDPFMGIGSTALSCVDLDVSFTGYDLDAEYLRVSCDRIESQLEQKRKEN